MISCPHPPSPPFPLRGRGSLKVYFAGGFAPGTPALNCLRHLQTPPCRSPAVVCPAGRRVDEHWRYPAGGLPGRSAARPALSFICCPHPPAPLPGGKGAFSFHMQGASPLASPRPSRKRHGLHLRCRCPAVVCPAGRRLTLPLALFLSPIPPAPFPAGRGRILLYFAGGSVPGTPALNRLRHLQTLPRKRPDGGCAFFLARLPCLHLFFCPPIPPPPFPGGEGGD